MMFPLLHPYCNLYICVLKDCIVATNYVRLLSLILVALPQETRTCLSHPLVGDPTWHP